MVALVAEKGAPGAETTTMDVSFQDLDVEGLFVNHDEMAVMKILQSMHLANFQLEDEIKGVMTEEIEPILLYSGNMMAMCSLVKQTQTALKSLSAMCREFELNLGHPGSQRGPKAYDEDQLLEFMNQCAAHYQVHGDFGTIVEEENRFDRMDVVLKAVQVLRRLSMDNFRLLKRNKLLMSYKLLKLQSPAFMKLVELLLHHGLQEAGGHEKPVKGARQVDEATDVGGNGNQLRNSDNVRHPGLIDARREQLLGFVVETHSALEYNTAKLLHNCEQALSSSDLELVVEASICLLLANEAKSEYPSSLWDIRLRSTKIEHYHPVLGSLIDCQEVLSQLLTTVMYSIFCQRVNESSIRGIKQVLVMPSTGSSDVLKTEEYVANLDFSEQEYWSSAMALMSRNIDRIEMTDIVEFYESCKSVVANFPTEVEQNKFLTSVFKELGVDIVKELSNVAKVLLNQLETIYHNGALTLAMSVVDTIERCLEARESCVASIKSMGKFLDRVDNMIAEDVNQQMTSVLENLCSSLEGLQSPLPGSGVFGTYGNEGTVQKWLTETKLNNFILSLEALWPAMETQAREVLGILARKCIVAPIGDDATVKTLIGTGALGSEYSLIGAQIFPFCLKKSVVEYWLDVCDKLSTRERAILILSVRDSGLHKDGDSVVDRVKDLEIQLGEAAINEHQDEYEGLKNFI